MATALMDVRRLVDTNRAEWPRTYAMAHVMLTKRYSGSALGIAWSIIRPLTYLLAFWFAVAVGLKGLHTIDGIGYLFWLMPAIMVWFFVQDAITNGGSAIRRNSKFVTKVAYPVATLPVSETLSYFLSHVLMMGVVTVVFIVTGTGLSLTVLQLPYYLLCAFVFSVVTATLLSALTAISADILQGVRALMTMLFWFTPVLWNVGNVPQPFRAIILANPITYLLVGYRDTYDYHRWFFANPGYATYFWALMAVMTLAAGFIYTRLEPQFADVL